MSSTYNSTTPSVDAQSSREYIDDLGLTHSTQFESSLLSPYNNSQIFSSSASPSYNNNSTPGESLSEYSNYQPSELSEVDDPFFGVDFSAGVHRIDSLPSTIQTYQPLEPLQTTQDPPRDTTNISPSEPRSASTYPLSPIHSSLHNTPSPKPSSNGYKSTATISQQELTELHNPGNHRVGSLSKEVPADQLTPDHSESSRQSSEDFRPTNMNRSEQSPRISVSQWETMNSHSLDEYFPDAGQQNNVSNTSDFANSIPQNISRGEDGAWQTNTSTGPTGLDPETRRRLSNTDVSTLKEQEEQRRLDHIASEVEEWRSQAGGSDSDENARNQSYFPSSNHIWDAQSSSHRVNPQDDDNDIAPVDDAASIRENRLVEGQTYYNFKNAVPNEFDYQLMNQSRHWSDAPVNPYITSSKYQPGSSNDAIRKWNANADTFSLASRAATWGTRRRSEPSLADWESVADGSFLKRLSISKSKDNGRPRTNSIFDQGLDRLANFARKRSNSKLKRSRSAVNIPEEPHDHEQRKDSQDTLAPPRHTSSFDRKSTPSINTTIAAMAGTMAAVGTTHARGRSVSNAGPTTSPKSPGLHIGGVEKLARSVIKRARSRSELTNQEKAAPAPGLAELWRKKGGPPVPALTPTQIEPEPKQPDIGENEEDDDDDDELEEEDQKLTPEEEADPITPNYEGFKAHVRRLNPEMDPRFNWLVSRIAHQQEIRYKNLLELRVKHSQAVVQRNCGAAHHCISLGGSATLMDAKGNPRDSDRSAAGLQLVTDFSDDSNPGEGALTDETFPQGVPRPPTKSLPAEFECQLCFKAKKFQKPSDWTKHVHEDVQPFTCTYDKCKEPKSFKRKADWVRHENERHRHLEWWVCQVDDCRHPCYRKDNFLQHLVREHKLPEPKQKTKAAIKKARSVEPAWIMLERCHHETVNRPQDEPCKFCGKTFATWKKLTVHLAKHMENISLPILRLVEARVVDADTIISPVEQIITPITPIGRNKIENSPYNLNNISPHGQMGSGFPGQGFDQRQFYQTPVTTAQYIQNHIPQDMNYNQSMYNSNFGVQSMESHRGFAGMAPDNHNQMVQNRNFGSIDSTFVPVKVEQPQPRGFGSMDSSYQQVLPDHNYQPVAHQGYSLPQNYSSAPAVSSYQIPDNHLVSNGGYDFDPIGVTSGPGFQQVPMSRAPGSGSSYGHSPHMGPAYYGQQ